jgi:arylsulfatase B/arylsulfatase I/J
MSAPLVLIVLGAMPGALSAQPHIALILVDDYGYNDIGYRNARNSDDIRTPVLDRLSAEGVRLENYYVNIACTPVSHVAQFSAFRFAHQLLLTQTRSALLSGRLQLHTGLQHGVIGECQPNALPANESTIAERLKALSYTTFMAGTHDLYW